MASQPQNQEPDWRNVEFKYDRFFFEMTVGILLVMVAVLIGFLLFPNDRGFQGNLYTTIIGVLITIFVLDRRAERREEKRRIQHEKENQAEALAQEKLQLIQDMGSTINPVAIRAIEKLKLRGHLDDSSLRGAILNEADLTGADLWNADLRGIWGYDANLQNADLYNAKLQEAQFRKANIKNARLMYCNLHSANLAFSQLQGADMGQADLQRVRFEYATFHENTILPDGTHWTPDIDLRRFTDPTHPNFWRSDNPASPTYRGNPISE